MWRSHLRRTGPTCSLKCVASGSGRRDAVPETQGRQVVALAPAVGRIDDDGDVRRALGRDERRVGPRVHFLRQRQAVGMVGGQS